MHKLNEFGGRLSDEYKIPYLYSDFKKRNGYKRSIELSAQYGLYRQNTADVSTVVFRQRKKFSKRNENCCQTVKSVVK